MNNITGFKSDLAQMIISHDMSSYNYFISLQFTRYDMWDEMTHFEIRDFQNELKFAFKNVEFINENIEYLMDSEDNDAFYIFFKYAHEATEFFNTHLQLFSKYRDYFNFNYENIDGIVDSNT